MAEKQFFENALADLARRLDSGRNPPPGVLVLPTLDQAYLAGELKVAFRWAAHFLVTPVGDEVWEWIVKIAETADPRCQAALSVGIFELMTDESPCVTKLFSLLKNPALWWIFLDLYEEAPAGFYEALKVACEAAKPA